jgi:hypothetical protein
MESNVEYVKVVKKEGEQNERRKKTHKKYIFYTEK